MTDLETAWLAGLLEGEGCFRINKRKRDSGKIHYYPQIILRMTDEDVIQRAAELMQCSYTEEERPNKNHKNTFRIQIYSKSNCKRIMEAVLPFMGKRRTSKIIEVLKVC